MPLDVFFAQNLCDQLDAELSLVCSFMDEAGHVIASSDRTHIGQVHTLARSLMAGEIAEFSISAAQAALAPPLREGVGMAIDKDGQRLACLTLTGPLAVVQPLARIVHFSICALLQAEHVQAPGAPLPALLQHTTAALNFSQTRLHQTIEHIDQGLTLFDIEMRLVVWNQHFLDLIGWPADRPCRGQTLQSLLTAFIRYWGLPQRGLQAQLAQRIARLRRGLTCDFEFKLPDGRVLAVADRPLPGGGAVTTYTDVTLRKHNEARIHQLAFNDPLTGLANRRLLLDRLEHALLMRSQHAQCGALFLLNVNDFKGLNDTRGHAVGDLLLQQMAERLGGCIGPRDTLARLSSDEFVVLQENLPAPPLQASTQAQAAGERMLQALAAPYVLQGRTQHHSASIGVVLFAQAPTSAPELLQQADLALARAKAAGRGALRFFDPQMQQALHARVALEQDLRQAMSARDFELHYQPQVHADGTVLGVEALLRWRRADGRNIGPAQFIPLAEDTGLILELGQRVLEAACAQLAQWARTPARAHLMLAVNVSARQFHAPGFVAQVLNALHASGAPAGRLKLELTESLLIDNLDAVRATMQALRAHGVAFALDDFGTGYSSLAYLKRLPLQELKIDQSFVRGILEDASDAAIARTVVTLAQSLGLSVIAEGVESDAERRALARIGCYACQGYHFSHPLALPALEAWLDAQAGAQPQMAATITAA